MPANLLQLKCPLTLVLVFCLWSLPGSGVDYPLRWRWSNPAPHGNNTVDMAYSPELSLAVQVAERGQIYTSDNLDLWIPRSSNVTNSLRAVTFFGPTARIIITGENGCVLYADSVNAFNSGYLIDGATTNWLEAVTASANLLVAVGDAGAVYTSQNGVAWKKQSAGSPTWWLGAAYGNKTFIMVGLAGSIASSTNGTNWIRCGSGVSNHLNRVSYSASNNRFTVAGDAGLLLWSTNNGVSWQTESSGATNDLYHTVTNLDSRIAVGWHEVRLQDQGVWSDELARSNGPPSWTYYANIGFYNYYLISGQTGMMAEAEKTNGTPYTWRPFAQSVRNWLWDVTCMNGLYVAVGDYATIMTSGNGVQWNLELPPVPLANSIFFGVGGTTNLLVGAGEAGSLMISPNTVAVVSVTNPITMVVSYLTNSGYGVVWEAIPRLTTNDLQGVTYANGLYVVTGDNGVVLISANGTNWTLIQTPTTKLLTSVAGWPGGFLSVGAEGALLTSPDGISWNVRTPFTTNWLYRVRYLNGNFIIVSQNGALYTSPNGTTWTLRSSGSTKWLTDIIYIDDTYFVCGYSGTVLASTNLTNWSNLGTITKKSLFALASDSRQLISVGVEGAILRCQVLPDLTPITILRYEQLPGSFPPRVQNVYLFGGKPDQQFTVDRCPLLDTNTWITGPSLEIFDHGGTLYYLETIYGTNVPVREFYRATVHE